MGVDDDANNTYYASLSEIQGTSNLTNIVNFAKATGRLDPDFTVPEETATDLTQD